MRRWTIIYDSQILIYDFDDCYQWMKFDINSFAWLSFCTDHLNFKSDESDIHLENLNIEITPEWFD